MRKPSLFLLLFVLISCSVPEKCGTIIKRETTINPSCIFVTIQYDNGEVSRVLTSDLSTKVGDYKCY